jgi:putative peptidoglycan lipid II flippase
MSLLRQLGAGLLSLRRPADRLAADPAPVRSTQWQIVRLTTLVSLLLLAGKMVSVLNDVVIGWAFGTSDELGIFFIALLIPSYGINVLASAFEATLVPGFVRTRDTHGLAAAQRYLSTCLCACIGLLIFGQALLWVAFPILGPALGSSFTPADLRLTHELFLIVLPMMLLRGVALALAAVLNAGHRFALTSLTPTIVPAATALAVLLYHDRAGVIILAWATTIGAALECGVLALVLWWRGISPVPWWYGADATVRASFHQFLPLVLGLLLTCSTGVIDQAMAAGLGAREVTTLNYGTKVVALLVALGANSLGTVVLPYFSRMIAHRDWGGVRRTLWHFSGLSLAIGLPVALILIFFSTPLVRLLFERGRFSAEDTELVAQVQACLALYIPFYTWYILTARLCSAMHRSHILLESAVLNVGLNVVLNLLFMHWFGLPGIGIAKWVVYACTTGYVLARLYPALRSAGTTSAESSPVAAVLPAATTENSCRYTFTVFTPSYNRAHTLPRVYESLAAQTFRDFEWLIVDDGSSDNTEDLVRGWQAQASFPIRYVRQPNGGKHVAFNRGVALAEGRFFLTFDSDDACISTALERFLALWESIPAAERDRYSAVTAMCADPAGRPLGDSFPSDVLDSYPIEIETRYRVFGDKWGFQRTDVLRQFPYPEIPGEKFMPEGVVWNRIGRHYRTRYSNELLKIVEYQPEGLSVTKPRLRMQNPQGFRLLYKEYAASATRLIWKIRQYVNYIRFSLHAGIGYSRLVGESGSPLLTGLIWPLGYWCYKRDLNGS